MVDPIREAPHLLASLFDDGGAEVLAAAGLPAGWAEALAPVPIDVLAVEPGENAGLRQLLGLRDWMTATGALPAALAFTRALLQIRTRTLGKTHPDTVLELAALGELLRRSGNPAEGTPMLDRAWSTLRSVAGGRDLRVAVVAQNVAAARLAEARGGSAPQALDEAEHALEIALRIRRETAPATLALTAAQLAEVRIALGRPEQAVGLLKEAWDLTATREGPRSPRALARAQMLGTVLVQLDRYGEAAKILRAVAAALDPDTNAHVRAAILFELGLAVHRTGGREEAVRCVSESVRLTRRQAASGEVPPALANRLTLLAELEAERGRLDEAEGLLREALDLERRRFGDAHPEVALRYAGLGAFLVRFGRADEGLGWLDAAASSLRRVVGDDDLRTRGAVGSTLQILAERITAAAEARDRDLARALVDRALELGPPVLGADNPAVRRIRELRDRHRLR